MCLALIRFALGYRCDASINSHKGTQLSQFNATWNQKDTFEEFKEKPDYLHLIYLPNRISRDAKTKVY